MVLECEVVSVIFVDGGRCRDRAIKYWGLCYRAPVNGREIHNALTFDLSLELCFDIRDDATGRS